MAKSDNMNFTPELAEEFKKKYKKALAEKEESFMFKGKEVVTGYAKYVIEYLEIRVLPENKITAILQEWEASGNDPHPTIADMPKYPEFVFRKSGDWKGWGEFLGNHSESNKTRDLLEDQAFVLWKQKHLN
tara:strand:+ start:149 stop:541 length:393 start_codon:yes stop_codon:yes gene_type:complete